MSLQEIFDNPNPVHAYLLVGNRNANIQIELESFFDKHVQLKAFAHFLRPEENSIDVEAAKAFRKAFYLQGVATTTFGVIEEIDKMTLPAQQMLLKLLEEAPPRVIFILTTTKPKTISLPLLSRVQVLRLKDGMGELDKGLVEKLDQLFDEQSLLFEKQQTIEKLLKAYSPDDLTYAISWYLWRYKVHLGTLQKWFVALSYVRHQSTLKNSLEYFFLT